MRNFEKATMTLFDSTNANFKLAVEAQFTRVNPDNSKRDLVYSTQYLNAILNPNIYLTFTYKGEDATAVYTSYPQLYRLRETFKQVADLVAHNEGFVEIDGVMTVRPECADPVVLANIGKKNNWISLKLSMIQSGEDGVVTSVPGVALELSTSNRYASVLTADEFLTVYTIINDLNLANLQSLFSFAFLATDRNVAGFYPQQAPVMQQPMGYSAPQQPQMYQAPMNAYQQPQGARIPAPQNNGGMQMMNRAPRQQSYRSVAPQQPAPAPAYNPAPQQNSLPPRDSGKPIMNMKAVEETPISEISYEDSSQIDSIFDEE